MFLPTPLALHSTSMIYCILVEHEPQDQQGWGILVGLDSVTSGCLLLLLSLRFPICKMGMGICPITLL